MMQLHQSLVCPCSCTPAKGRAAACQHITFKWRLAGCCCSLQVHTAVLDDLIERLQEAIDKRQLQVRQQGRQHTDYFTDQQLQLQVYAQAEVCPQHTICQNWCCCFWCC
jgi:hypothetical protein